MSSPPSIDEKSPVTAADAKRAEAGYANDPAATAEIRTTSSFEDGDEALELVGGSAQRIVITEAENARLLRKIDLRVLPLMCIIYGLQYLDKTTLSYASIMGLRTDTHLATNQYQWLGSIFYLGYLVWEWPANRLMQRLPIAKYTAFNIVVWGVVLCCMAAGRNWGDLMAIRFLLGLFEASVTPGFALITSQWYRVNEQGWRTGIWFSFNGFASIFGSCVAYGLATHAASLSLAGWKVVFVLTGTLTIAFGFLLLFFLPDSPVHAWWLTPEERVMAIERLRINQQGVGNKHFKWYQVKEALTDPQAWMIVIYTLLADIPNGGLTNYFSILIESFGFSAATSLLYGAPGGAIEVVTILGFMYLGHVYKKRLLFGATSLAIALLGILLVYCLPDRMRVGRLIGYSLTQASATGWVALLSLISSNMAGYTKKTTVSAMTLIAYCVGNLIGPQVFRDKDAPKYTPALITIVVCWVICIVLLLAIWAYNVRENGRRDALVAAEGEKRQRKANHEFLDLTDMENPDFRYVF